MWHLRLGGLESQEVASSFGNWIPYMHSQALVKIEMKAVFMYTLTLDCSFSSLSSKHLSSVYSLIIPDDIWQRRHSPCPQGPLKSGLRKKPNILHHQWHHKVVSGSNFCMGGVCVCCLNVPNGKRRFELGPKQWLQYAWPRAQHQQRHSVASGAEAGIVGWPRSFIHSFLHLFNNDFWGSTRY